MQHILPLYITFIAAFTAANTGVVSALESKPNFCDCYRPDCERLESSPTFWDKVRLHKKPSEKGKIFCFSDQPIKWTFGSSSAQIPHANFSELRITNETEATYREWVFCLTLRVIPESPSWVNSTLFAKCETETMGNGASRWYKLDRNGSFVEQDSAFNPTVTWNSSNSYNEAVDTTEEPSTSTGYFNAVNHTTQQFSSDHSPVNHQPSVPLSVVIASAGGAAAFVLLLLILVFILVNKVKQQRKQIELTKEEIDEFLLGVPRHKATAKGMNDLFVLPYDTSLEIPKSDMTFRPRILGSGAFGQVVQGEYQGNQVAIKMLKSNANSNADYLRSLLGELKVMSYLGSHPNLVGLVGSNTENIKGGEAYLIFEYCSNGNVQSFVRNHRDDFVDLLTRPATSSPFAFRRTRSFTTKDLVRWGYEVASGMEYVSAKKVYHGDLAARNILLTDNLTAKVGDFGLSKQLDMERYSVYVKQTQCPLPVKWMAIESLRNLTFSIQSDVWSYGVTLWEFFTLGATPYPGMDWNFDSWKLLSEGKRLDRPEYASDSLYKVMMNCWDADPKSRPSFAQLQDILYTELQNL